MGQEQTPLMKQYWSVKAAHPDKILFFRMGDFYELFYEDAVKAAPLLGITLTSRNKKSEDETPMCGMPHHSIAAGVNKLLSLGIKIAICDQIEDPKHAKGIVKRAVTRILTPGMVYDANQLDAQIPNFLACCKDLNLVCLDATTGDVFEWNLNTRIELVERLLSLNVKELLISSDADLISDINVNQTVFKSDWSKTPLQILTAYTAELGLTQLRLKALVTISEFDVLRISGIDQRNLELFTEGVSQQPGGLLKCLDHTQTPMGARALRLRMTFPWRDPVLLQAHWDKVEFWIQQETERLEIQKGLKKIGDLERKLHKLMWSQVQPRDLKSFEQSLESLSELYPFLKNEIVSGQWQFLCDNLSELRRYLMDQPSASFDQGSVIRPEVDEKLHEAFKYSTEGQRLINELEQREKEQTGIASLKVRFNNVFGYYIEITNTHKDRVPSRYLRKQTLANAERYTTPELTGLEQKLSVSEATRIEIEKNIFAELCKKIVESTKIFLALTSEIAKIDIVLSMASHAVESGLSKPKISPSDQIIAKGSFHPVLAVKAGFVRNDLTMKPGDALLVTGPNMAGKSTFMRQLAVTCVMAQMGSFVPAREFEFKIIDQILTRIGAHDHQAKGLSTFMVEMTEAAEILRLATEDSLVIMDEVGRGTSTFDGLSLAQAILEFLVTEKKPWLMFATHYHELADLENKLKKIRNVHMGISEQKGEIKFLYSLMSGAARKSYGIHVAQLAKLPDQVILRATSILQEKEAAPLKSAGRQTKEFHQQLSFETEINQFQQKSSELIKQINALQIQHVTPIQALNKIKDWQDQISEQTLLNS